MKLYHARETRGTRPRWLLEELGVPYDLVWVDMDADEHRRPEHLSRHPLGRVPVLEADGRVFFESGAMCLYLADRFPEKGFAPPAESVERAIYNQWFCFALTELEPPLTEISMHTWELPKSERIPEILPYFRRRFAAAAGALEARLDPKPYAMGRSFTALDVLLGCMLSWAHRSELLDGFPTLNTYREHVLERPVAKRLFAEENP